MTLPITVEKIAHKNVLGVSMQHVNIRLKDNMSSVQPDLEHKLLSYLCVPNLMTSQRYLCQGH